jgi:hypothetical protein
MWLQVLGAVVGGIGAIKGGKAAKRSAYAKAAGMERRAGQERAKAQMRQNEEERQAELLESRARAVAGVSGTGLDSPGIISTIDGIRAEGAYRGLIALWNGEEEATGLESGAAISRMEGDAAKTAGTYSAIGTVFQAVGDS